MLTYSMSQPHSPRSVLLMYRVTEIFGNRKGTQV